MKQPAVYILASGLEGTLYVGVTSDLVRRVGEHRSGVSGGFAAQYRCILLVYFELFGDMAGAIRREKQITSGSRRRKVALIEAGNAMWRDLYPEIL
jgi:predicted GIY-YIG superfamily endonuclease